jgi:hypothetical protein
MVDQMVDPTSSDVGEVIQVGGGINVAETMIPESSDFDMVPDIHDIDL